MEKSTGRKTRQLEVVWHEVAGDNSHPTADQIYARLGILDDRAVLDEAADLEAAIAYFDSAREADPNFADATAMAAHARLRTAFHFPSEHKDSMIAEAKLLLQTALRQDSRNLTCLLSQGWLHHHFNEPDLAISSGREAVARNHTPPGLSLALLRLR